MANLSNINGKFVVEQTTGFVGIGTTDPGFLIEAAGTNAELALNASSIYRIRSTASDEFIITKNGVGDRLTISGGGDAIFGGNVKISGTQEKVLELDSSADSGAIHFEEGGTIRGILGFSNGTTITPSAADNDMVLRSEANLLLTTNAATLALKLDTSQNATFAGNVEIGVADGGERKLTIHGGATGSSEGGQIELHTAADYDTTYAFYRIDAYQDDLRIGRAGTTDWQLNSSGYVGVQNRLGVGTLTPNNIFQLVGNMTIGTGATNETERTIMTGGTIVLQATDANHRIIIRGTQDAAGTVTGNSNNMDFYEFGGYNFYTGVNASSSARTLALSMASDGDATFTGGVIITTASSPGLKISKDKSVDNRFLRFNDTASGGKDYDIINNGNLAFYNHTDNNYILQITSAGNATFPGVVTVNNSIQVQNDDSGFICRNSAGTVIGTMGAESSSTPNVGMTTIRNNGTTTIQFNSNGNSYITGGSLGIGTTTPGTTLDVRGSGEGVYIGRITASPHLRLQQFNGTVGSPTATANGERVGQVSFEPRVSGGSFLEMCGIFGVVNGTVSSSAAPTDLVFAAGSSGAISSNERMRINSSGDIGIGTTPETAGPTWRTLFIGASATIVSRQAAGGYDSIFANNYYVNSSNQDRVRTTGPSSRMFLDGNNIRFQISPSTGAGGSPTWSEIMRVDDSGNVGIGTTSPTAKLDISGMGTGGVGVRIKDAQNVAGSYYYGFMFDGTDIRGTTQSNIFYAGGSVNANTTIADWASIRIDTPSVAATGAVVTNNYGIYQSSTLQKNYFAGNVGIGTTDLGTEAKLAIGATNANEGGQIVLHKGTSGTLAAHIDAYHSTNDYLRILSGTNTASSSAPFVFDLTNTRLGIGTTSPGTKLDVNGAGSTGTITWANDGGRKRGYLYSDSAGVAIYSTALSTAGIYLADSAQIDFRLGGSVKMLLNNSGTLTVSGDLVAYGSPSDKRLKENIKPIESALDKVVKLQGVTFDWKESDSMLNIKEDIGFIAQDVQKVIPELVRENEDGMLSMRHQGIAPILLEAIKELKAEIEELKKNSCDCKK